jgi:O-antigen/teichoic acid export membrane protein
VQAAQTFMARSFAYGVGFVAAVLIARFLGPTGRGSYYVVVTVAVTAVSVGHLSVEQSNLYLWPRWPDRRQLVGASALAAAVLGIVVAVIAGIVVVGPARGWVPLDRPDLLWVALLGIPVQLAGLYGAGLLVAGGRLRANNVALLCSALLHLAVIAVLAATGRLGVSGVVVAWLVAAAVLTGLQWRGVLVSLGVRRPTARLLRRLLSVGLRYHLGMVAIYLILRVDIFMLNALTDTAQVGLYSVAVTLAEATYLVTDSVGQAAVSRQIDSRGTEYAYTARITRTNFVLSLLAVGSLVLSAPVAVPFVFGESFRATVGGLVALAPGIVAFATLRPLTVFGNQRNRPLLVAGAYLVGLAANIALNVWLIPELGIMGAGVASSVTYGLIAVFHCVWFLRVSGMAPSSLRPRVRDVADPVVMLARIIRQRWRGGL